MNNKKEIREILNTMEKAALSAAKIIHNRLSSPQSLGVWRKDDQSLVTEADIESQNFLVQELCAILPVVGEEDKNSHSIIETQSDYLVIDPLDGTTSAKRFGCKAGGEVGFGPIIGLVLDSRLVASVFVNLPQAKAFSAHLGQGCECFSIDGTDICRSRLPQIEPMEMTQSALLFFAGKNGELSDVFKLRQQSSLENYYRFGGFANDSSRIALNQEQLQLQYSVKVWDFPATLLPYEVGCRVVFNPLSTAVDFLDHKPTQENPVLLGHPNLVEDTLKILRS
jgi:fructose-1,6-bisphosphatase/inositol monophosphatase family enzyme